MTEIYFTTVLGGVGLSLLANCISSLTTSANGIYTLIGNIIHNRSTAPDIYMFLKESDIQTNIQILTVFIKEINIGDQCTKSLTISLNALKDCVSDIEEKLHEVKKRIDYNKSLWFFISYRSYNFLDIVCELKLLKITLDNRWKNLIDILKINNCLTPLSESIYLDMIKLQSSAVKF